MSYWIGSNYRKDPDTAPLVPYGIYTVSMLHEANTANERAELHRTYDKVRKVTAAEAHRWVKDGGLHSTYLYVGIDGRIHRATEEKD